MSQLFTSGGQSIGVSASASVLPNEYQMGWFSGSEKEKERLRAQWDREFETKKRPKLLA